MNRSSLEKSTPNELHYMAMNLNNGAVLRILESRPDQAHYYLVRAVEIFKILLSSNREEQAVVGKFTNQESLNDFKLSTRHLSVETDSFSFYQVVKNQSSHMQPIFFQRSENIHIDSAVTLHNLALSFVQKGQLDKALKLLKYADTVISSYFAEEGIVHHCVLKLNSIILVAMLFLLQNDGGESTEKTQLMERITEKITYLEFSMAFEKVAAAPAA